MTIHSIFRRIVALPAVLVLATLTGCASQITSQELTPTPVQVAKQHPQSVTVAVLPPATSGAVAALVPAAELRTAVNNAVLASKAFADVKPEGGAYQLAVQIFTLDTPMFGGAMTSKIEMGWTLKRAEGGAPVWQESIKSEHTTTMSEAFVGVERGKKSIAGAIQKNIDAALKRISTQSL